MFSALFRCRIRPIFDVFDLQVVEEGYERGMSMEGGMRIG